MEKFESLQTLAAMVDGVVVGDGTARFSGLAALDNAGPAEITFLAKAKEAHLLAATGAGAAIVPQGVSGPANLPLIQVADPYLAAAIIHNHFLATPFNATGIHPRAVVSESCRLGSAISIGPLAVIGEGVRLGERVTIAAGAVIGSDGYGYATNRKGEHVKRPQVGRVRIDDDVEIGANCCIDRATFGETWIKSGAKIDNLVQIAHNVVVGENSLIVAQVGIAGSCVLGRNVVLGGQVGLAGHLRLGDRVMVAAQGGVHNDQEAGAVIGGYPAIPVRQWAKCSSVYGKLPDLNSEVRKLSKAVAELRGAEADNE